MLLMAAMCVLGFTSCSDDDDIGDNPDTPSKEIPLTRMTTLCSIAIPQEHAVCFTTTTPTRQNAQNNGEFVTFFRFDIPVSLFPINFAAFFTRKNLSAIQHLSQLSGIKMIAAEWFIPQTFQRWRVGRLAQPITITCDRRAYLRDNFSFQAANFAFLLDSFYYPIWKFLLQSL